MAWFHGGKGLALWSGEEGCNPALQRGEGGMAQPQSGPEGGGTMACPQSGPPWEKGLWPGIDLTVGEGAWPGCDWQCGVWALGIWWGEGESDHINSHHSPIATFSTPHGTTCAINNGSVGCNSSCRLKVS